MSEVLQQLWQTIQERKQHPTPNSYTASLFAKGEQEILKKIGEEAVEVIVAGLREGNERLIYETADLLYHLMVLLAARDLTWEDVEQELARRFKP
ncbi:MAG: phosphoribosyl-ATP diphosphatase [Chloroflexi bacterium]|nr:phosphoribosyl-ATP diphosphatase [Chloroflexota bacterium]